MNAQSEHNDASFMAAAAACFAEYGFDRVAVAQIARRTALPEHKIRKLYGDDRELFVAVFEWYSSCVLAVRMGKLEAELAPADAAIAMLEETVAACVSAEHGTPYRLLEVAIKALGSSSALQNAISAALGDIEAFLYRCILSAQGSGHLLNRQRPEDLARFVLGTLVATNALVHACPGRSSVDSIMHPILTLLRKQGD
jgi:AcrR family transcriptional regulator